jgi:2-keto-4-pentenoate hydratase/2-oxohepta-3-ene-1,7-dioic acid hydratase in catechol pathway
VHLVSVVVDGQRKAGILEGERALVTDVPGLDTAIAQGIALTPEHGRWLRLADVRLDAPLRPPVVLCSGQNYRDHLAEKAPVEVKEPEFFLKAGQTIAAPDQPCVLDPIITVKLDYETELGVVIGKAGRHIHPDRAMDHVYGYVVVNDLSARDRQVVRSKDGCECMALGPSKNFEGATRLAPWITTAEEVGDPNDLTLSTRVSGELRQHNNTRNMLFSIAEIIAHLSKLLTLEPGTVIATGTPGGTGWGMDPTLGGTGRTPTGCAPARYLAAGDVVEGEIERVGRLTFEVVADNNRE